MKSEKRFKIHNPMFREIIVEFFGTLILMLVGCAACAALSLNPQKTVNHIKDKWAIGMGWGFGAFIGIALSLHISGGHINPAVTVAMATIGKFSWKKVIPYIMAQYFGSFIGTALAYLCYYEAITVQNSFLNETDRIYGNPLSTGAIFTTFPAPHVSISGAIIDQIIGTASLLFGVMAIADSKSLNIPKTSHPLLLAFLIAVHCTVFGFNSGAPLNPARDLGPRLFIAISGWGWDVFKPLNWCYWWCGGIVGPHLGALCGVWIYYFLIEYHHPENTDHNQKDESIQITPMQSSYGSQKKFNDYL